MTKEQLADLYQQIADEDDPEKKQKLLKRYEDEGGYTGVPHPAFGDD